MYNNLSVFLYNSYNTGGPYEKHHFLYTGKFRNF